MKILLVLAIVAGVLSATGCSTPGNMWNQDNASHIQETLRVARIVCGELGAPTVIVSVVQDSAHSAGGGAVHYGCEFPVAK